MEQARDDHIDELRRILLDHLPAPVITVLQDVRQAGSQAADLVQKLEAVRRRFNLVVPGEDEDAAPQEPAVARIVCSHGLVAG